jgi:hypothetical protein
MCDAISLTPQVNVIEETGEVIGLIHERTLPMEMVEWMKQEGNTDAASRRRFSATDCGRMSRSSSCWPI